MLYFPIFLLEVVVTNEAVVTRLKLVEHDVEGGVVEDEVDVVLAETKHIQEIRIWSKYNQSSMLL